MKSSLLPILLLLTNIPILSAEESLSPQAETVIFKGKLYKQDFRFNDEEQKLFADLDGDGKDELIWTFRATPEKKGLPRAFNLIYEINANNKKLIKTIRGNERPDHIDFVDLNKDGKKGLAIFTTGGNHYTSLAIYQYQNKDYVPIFEEGSASPVLFDAKANPPIVKIGRGNWSKKDGWAYKDEPLWEVYKWSGKRFEYSKELSNTSFIGEERDIRNAVDYAVKKSGDPAPKDLLVFIAFISGAKVEDYP